MKLSSLFSDHMVFQRGKDVAVWGWGVEGDRVTVEFAGQKETALVAQDGQWLATLKSMAASNEPRKMLVRSERGEGEITIRDVLVGEVWLASGQSNMQWSVTLSADSVAEIAAANHPRIRLFTAPNRAIVAGLSNIDAAWQVCSPETVEVFSAVAYFFGRRLHQELGVPVGLINSSWGGTRIEAWMSRGALAKSAEALKDVEAYEGRGLDEVERKKWEEFARDPVGWERTHAVADPGNGVVARGWASAEFDDSQWGTMDIPSPWQNHGHDYSGVFWFRREVEIPADWAGHDLELHIGACDKHDTTYFNGSEVGGIGWEKKDAWCTPRVYRISGELVRAGRNVIATRVYSYLYQGGMIGPGAVMKIFRNDSPDRKIPLSGRWRFAVEHNLGLQTPAQAPLGDGNPNTPYILYDCMIRPLLPYGLRGAIWYQGESNADKPRHYGELFPLMIRDWRAAFGQGEMAFLFVQLASYMAVQERPSERGWALLREAQSAALKEPHTGMAVAIDIGDAVDIHPQNKQDVGKRLALAALAQFYGVKLIYSGPMFKSFAIEGAAIRLRFNFADGLKTPDGGAPAGFAIAGADREFYWADAKIEGDSVIVHNSNVALPLTVRYAWANNPRGNLVNSAGLPASPFRTDPEF